MFKVTSATSLSSNSASVSGVGVRCSNVFGSDSSVSVGCSDSVSGVGARGFS